MRTVPPAFEKQKVKPVYLLQLDTLRYTDGPDVTVSTVAYSNAPFTVDGIDLSSLDQKPTIVFDCSDETYRQLMLSGIQGTAVKLYIGAQGETDIANFRELYAGEVDDTNLGVDKFGNVTGNVYTSDAFGLSYTVDDRIHPDADIPWNHILEVGTHQIAGTTVTVTERA